MSSRKSKQGVIWSDCTTCGVRLLKSNATKHGESKCNALFPMIENGVLIISFAKPTSTSAILKLPFVKSAIGNCMLFVPEFVMRECELESFTWVFVSNIGSESSNLEEPNSEAPPIAMQIWPVVDDTTTTSASAYLTDEALLWNSQLIKNSPHSVEKSRASFHEAAATIDIELIYDREVDPEKFSSCFLQNFRGRIVTAGNRFSVRFFTETINIVVSRINSNAETLEESLCRKVGEMTVGGQGGGGMQSLGLKYYEIVFETKITVTNPRTKVSETEVKILPTLEDVGGLNCAIKELKCFINFVYSGASKVPPGVLIYGSSGTGKTLLMSAICNSMNITCVSFKEYGIPHSKSRKYLKSEVVVTKLEDAVNKALANQPAAIVIEDIETASLTFNSQSKNVSSLSFSHKLRSLLTSVMTSKVILLATTAKIDSLDVTVRSPQLFSKEVEVSVPAYAERVDICSKILSKFDHRLSEENVKSIASATHGYVGADLSGLFSEAEFIRNKRSHLNREEFGIHNVGDRISMEEVGEAMKIVHPSAMKSILIDVPNVKWSDIGGQDELKLKLKQMIEWPLKHPEVFQRMGIVPPKGILMFGPPGCSKTMVAKAIATESGLNFIAVKASELFSKWVGESEKAVQKIFTKARQVSPCIVFFDEIDSLGGERGSSSGSSNVHERVLAQLLVEMDGIQPLKDVTIIAATNRPDIIDQALLRPGRLDRIMYVPLPDLRAREEIFRIQSKKMPFDESVDIQALAHDTEGYSGAEITAVCQEAGLHALEEDIKACLVKDEHFVLALQSVRPRITKEQIKFYDDYNEKRKARG